MSVIYETRDNHYRGYGSDTFHSARIQQPVRRNVGVVPIVAQDYRSGTGDPLHLVLSGPLLITTPQLRLRCGVKASAHSVDVFSMESF